jgi:hypothetical protein
MPRTCHPARTTAGRQLLAGWAKPLPGGWTSVCPLMAGRLGGARCRRVAGITRLPRAGAVMRRRRSPACSATIHIGFARAVGVRQGTGSGYGAARESSWFRGWGSRRSASAASSMTRADRVHRQLSMPGQGVASVAVLAQCDVVSCSRRWSVGHVAIDDSGSPENRRGWRRRR